MKRIVSIFTMAAIALTLVTTPAFAKNDKNKGKGKDSNNGFSSVLRMFGKDNDGRAFVDGRFYVLGTVGSTTASSIVINAKTFANVPNVTNNLVTINVDANTKIKGNSNQTLTLADVKVGQSITATGATGSSTLTAQNVFVDLDKNSNQFSLTGTVGSTTSGSIVINVAKSKNVPKLTNNIASVNVDANTKYTAGKKDVATLADVKAGTHVTVTGAVSGTTLTGQSVHINLPKGKVYGEVTAKTATSVTVKNSVTGTTQTINTDADTTVKINGETKTVADVQVGDKGFVKFKTKVSGMFAKVINLFR